MSTSPPTTSEFTAEVRRREIVGRGLLAGCAVMALAAGLSAVPGLAGNGETLIVESWRMTGLVMFAGLFAVLAWQPRTLPGVFELVIGHKAVMTIIALANSSAEGAREVAIADGLLTAVLLTAYVLTRAGRSSAAATRRLLGSRRPEG